MKQFYYAADGSSIDKILAGQPVLVSAAMLWKKGKFNIPGNLEGASEIMLDSGGYSCFVKWEKYPFTPEKYIEFVCRFKEKYPQLEYAVTMDYPCEKNINRSLLPSNIDRIDATIENTEILLSENILVKWISVIQGGAPGEYLYCIRKLKERDLMTDRMGVGSICTRKRVQDLIGILRGIRRETTAGLHAFGVDLRFLRNRVVWDLIETADSGAWRFQDGRARGCGGCWRPRDHEDKKRNFNRYKGEINGLLSMRDPSFQRVFL